MTHAFVVEFQNSADREYYIHEDPAHLAFAQSLGDIAAGAQMISYQHGVL
jgi:hypothetical protein